MMKFAPINTYTKEDIIWYLETFNTGKRCVSRKTGLCCYKTRDNHCAVGCFIPHGHKGLGYAGGVFSLLQDYPDLIEKMPLNMAAMRELQEVHDRNHFNKESTLNIMIQWVKNNVKDES